MENSNQPITKKEEDEETCASEIKASQLQVEHPKNMRITRTLESILDQMKVTDEEINYRTEVFDSSDSIKDYFKCTKCNLSFHGSKNINNPLGIHPLLGVLMCDNCCDYYGDGNFSLDSEGDDKYCRWCGEGGTLFECSKCICGFCDKCIEKHFGKDVLRKVRNDDDWVCYICDPKPLWYLRSVCVIAKESVRRKRERNFEIRSKRIFEVEVDDSDEDSDKCSSKSSSDFSRLHQFKRKKRKKISKAREKNKKDVFFSSDDEKDNVARKSRFRNLSSKEESTMSEGSTNPKKKQKISSPCTSAEKQEQELEKSEEAGEEDEETIAFNAKKTVVVEKLTGIWKLTESITEVGLKSSRERLKKLSKPDYIKTKEDLEREYGKLRSFLVGLSSTFRIACNSVSSVKVDIDSDNAIEELENLQVEETELKKIAKVLEEDSDSQDVIDPSSDKKSKAKREPSPSLPSTSFQVSGNSGSQIAREVKSDNRNGKSPSAKTETLSGFEAQNNEKLSEEKSVLSRREDGKDKDDDASSSAVVRPMLKVKSFAKMVERNIFEACSSKSHRNEEEMEMENEKGKENDKDKDKEKESESESESEKEMEKQKEKEKEKEEENEEEKENEREMGKKTSSQVDEYNAETEGTTDDEKNESKKKKYKRNRKKKKKRKRKAESSGSNFSDDVEETTKIVLRRVKKERKTMKVSFEKFKLVREKFLRSKTSVKGESKKATLNEKSERADSSDIEGYTGKSPKGGKKRRMIVRSSDEEEKGTAGKENDDQGSGSESSHEKAEEESDDSQKKLPSSTSESSSDEQTVSKRRKRKKSSSNESGDQGNEENGKKQKGRKNIKKILKKDSLHVETKEALKAEEERRKRVEERNKLFEELFPEYRVTDTEVPKEVILDFDLETKEPLVTVHRKLVKKLKPHQVKGVKFMWDNCFESVKRLEEDHGSGCILAHCMGLGKTLQVVTLVHTLMTHDLGVDTVLVVCPLSTVNNWINEFEIWLENIKTEPIILYNFTKYKKTEERQYYLENWQQNGGVLVISYDLFRTLTKAPSTKGKKGNKSKKQRVFEEALLDPGPDLVICDEGHLLKNEDTALSRCMNRIKTSRRIVLTGTPLQNNLMEYHCMVQFVKPNILGTKKEFSNRFMNPINNGQFEDSTALDVKIMKRRSHVLHSMLSGCVQRFDYSVLTPFLPEKHEYVLSICLTETQAKVYRTFISNYSAKGTGAAKAATLFNDFHNLQRIWTHPRTMLLHSQKENMRDVEEDSEGSLKDFVVSDEDEDENSSLESSGCSQSSEEKARPKKRILRSNANDADVQKAIEEEEKIANRQWWDDFFKESDYEDIRASNKLLVLFWLLKRCEEVRDKVLVFSQSLYSLDLIEYFLNKIDEGCDKEDNETLGGFKDRWVLGMDYFRLDGSTSSDLRTLWCKQFNKESNKRARLFLISTRAGGLGINLFAANRVVIFDASWNPSHDVQSIFRVYRFGQKKTCYIYRFLAEATMEEKIYERQVTKLSLAHRVVDEHQIERHYSMMNLQELYRYNPTPEDQWKVPMLPRDEILADLLSAHKKIIVGYHEHDSLLENQEEEELSEEERKAAWKEYEAEKENKGFVMVDAVELQRRLQMQGILPHSSQMVQDPIVQMSSPAIRLISPSTLVPNQVAMVQSFVNPVTPMYANTTIPLHVIQRGIQLGVTPLFNESCESYFNRIKNREHWLQMGQGPRET